jgi:hypothetical protein
VEQSHILAGHLSGDLCAEVDLLRCAVAQTDAAAEEGENALGAPGEEVLLLVSTREIEGGRAVEKEIPAFGEEQGVAREVDLALIDLSLGEVGIDRQIGPYERRRVVEEVETSAGVGGAGDVTPAGRGLGGEQAVGLDRGRVPG